MVYAPVSSSSIPTRVLAALVVAVALIAIVAVIHDCTCRHDTTNPAVPAETSPADLLAADTSLAIAYRPCDSSVEHLSKCEVLHRANGCKNFVRAECPCHCKREDAVKKKTMQSTIKPKKKKPCKDLRGRIACQRISLLGGLQYGKGCHNWHAKHSCPCFCAAKADEKKAAAAKAAAKKAAMANTCTRVATDCSRAPCTITNGAPVGSTCELMRSPGGGYRSTCNCPTGHCFRDGGYSSRIALQPPRRIYGECVKEGSHVYQY